MTGPKATQRRGETPGDRSCAALRHCTTSQARQRPAEVLGQPSAPDRTPPSPKETETGKKEEGWGKEIQYDGRPRASGQEERNPNKTRLS